MSTKKDSSMSNLKSLYALLSEATDTPIDVAMNKLGEKYRQNVYRARVTSVVPHKSRWPMIAKAFGASEAVFWQCFMKAFRFVNLK